VKGKLNVVLDNLSEFIHHFLTFTPNKRFFQTKITDIIEIKALYHVIFFVQLALLGICFCM